MWGGKDGGVGGYGCVSVWEGGCAVVGEQVGGSWGSWAGWKVGRGEVGGGWGRWEVGGVPSSMLFR